MHSTDNDRDARRARPTLYGRRKGKRLRSHHQSLIDELLPHLRVAPEALRPDPRAPFASPEAWRDLWIEIGFGGGEHLAADAQRHPDIAFIGCEPFVNGVAKLLAEIEERGLRNIRIHADDALDVLRALPDASVGRIAILYPDPWPKLRQRKRRFMSPDSLDEIARVLRPDGVLRFATDIDDYSAWLLALLAPRDDLVWSPRGPHDWLTPWEGWTRTRYEGKALREGRRPAYFTIMRAQDA